MHERQFESAFPCILVHPLHGLHELLALFKLLEQAIDILDTLATARGNALRRDPLIMRGFCRSFGVMDVMMASNRADFLAIKIHAFKLLAEFSHAGNHAQDGFQGTQPLDLFHLVKEHIEGELVMFH